MFEVLIYEPMSLIRHKSAPVCIRGHISNTGQLASPNRIVGTNTATHPQVIGNPAIHKPGKHDSSDDGAQAR